MVRWGSRRGNRGTRAGARRISGSRATNAKQPKWLSSLPLIISSAWKPLSGTDGSAGPGDCSSKLPTNVRRMDGRQPRWPIFAIRMTGDWEEALRQAKLAQGIGERLALPAIQALALQQQGYALVAMGRVDEGLALIDESTVAAVSGELDPMTTGRIYCSTINVCRNLADWRRAVEWTDAAERWCRRQGVSGFPGVCRVHRAEIMHFRGSWADAEREAKRACEELGRYDLLLGGEAQYEIGEVRLRVGDLEGAREAFRQARQLSREPEPGMSLLRLAEGDAPGANTSIKRTLAGVESRAFIQARLLPAAVEIGLAAGDLDSVAQHVAELEEIAGSFGTTAVTATAEYGRGLLLLAQGDIATAMARLRHAVELWHELGAPYETARARTALGEALRADGDEDAAASRV